MAGCSQGYIYAHSPGVDQGLSDPSVKGPSCYSLGLSQGGCPAGKDIVTLGISRRNRGPGRGIQREGNIITLLVSVAPFPQPGRTTRVLADLCISLFNFLFRCCTVYQLLRKTSKVLCCRSASSSEKHPGSSNLAKNVRGYAQNVLLA